MHSLRRTLTNPLGSTPSGEPDAWTKGVYSTPEERQRSSPNPSATMRSLPPPTHQQIAMGLHLSRTPHFRSAGDLRQRPTSPNPNIRRTHSRTKSSNRDDDFSRRASTSAPPLPPPPSRSSLKQTSSSDESTPTTSPGFSDISLPSSVTSNTSRSSLSALRWRMSKFAQGKNKPPTPPISAIMDEAVPKKAVRFTTGV